MFGRIWFTKQAEHDALLISFQFSVYSTGSRVSDTSIASEIGDPATRGTKIAVKLALRETMTPSLIAVSNPGAFSMEDRQSCVAKQHLRHASQVLQSQLERIETGTTAMF